jgi:carbamoyl-phosphate synthase large subunit
MKVLMTGAGAPGGPGIIKALMTNPAVDLHVCDVNPYASGRFLVDGKFHLVPKATDHSFIDRLMDICLKNKIEIIFPLVTLELFKLSKYKKIFLNNNIKIIVSDEDALNIANNKGLLYKHLTENEIKVPDFYVVNSKKQLLSVAIKLGYPAVPIVMKPCVGNGSRGIRVLDDHVNRFDLLFNKKPLGIISRLTDVLDDIGENEIPELVVSEYLPGDELTIDTIVENGKVEDCLVRTRNTINGGISTSGTFICNDEVDQYIKRIVSKIPGLCGPIGFQVKKSFADEYLLLECNPRIQGTSVAAFGLGINLPLRVLQHASGIPREDIIKTAGISFCRYYQEVFFDS